MSKLIKLSDSKNAPQTRTFKEIRADFGLSRAQAALALDVSRASIDNWERKPCTNLDDAKVTAKFQVFAAKHGSDLGLVRNLIFGRYPLRMAREILELDVAEVAQKYGYSESAWKKFEANGRPLKTEIMQDLERDVRDAFISCCAP